MTLKQWLHDHHISINNPTLIEEAFIHRSFQHEHKMNVFVDNQRLEFMGDAVLQLWTARFLYDQKPFLDEGSMTKLRASMVNEFSLAQCARTLELAQFLKLGKGEQNDRGDERDSTLADLFEAFIGALYLDSGFTYLEPLLNELFNKPLDSFSHASNKDYKTQLQEYVQAEDRRTIEYVLNQVSGPANQREFEIHVQIDGMIYGKGKGTSKKRAEQAAAQEALAKLVK